MRSLFVVLLAAGCLSACSRSESPDGWAPLFDGSDLDAFDTVGDANWTIVDGTVRADEGDGFLGRSSSCVAQWLKRSQTRDPGVVSSGFGWLPPFNDTV